MATPLSVWAGPPGCARARDCSVGSVPIGPRRPRDPTARPALPGRGRACARRPTCTRAPLPPPVEPAPGPPGQSPRRALGVGARRGRVGPWARRRSVAASCAGRVPGPRGLAWSLLLLLLRERGPGRGHVQGAGGRARGPARRSSLPRGRAAGRPRPEELSPLPCLGGRVTPSAGRPPEVAARGSGAAPVPTPLLHGRGPGGPGLIRTPGVSLSCGRTGRAADVPSRCSRRLSSAARLRPLPGLVAWQCLPKPWPRCGAASAASRQCRRHFTGGSAHAPGAPLGSCGWDRWCAQLRAGRAQPLCGVVTSQAGAWPIGSGRAGLTVAGGPGQQVTVPVATPASSPGPAPRLLACGLCGQLRT